MRKIGEKVGERAGEVIRDKIFPREGAPAARAPQLSQKAGVYGKIETRYPRLDGTANPWIMSTLYNKAYKSQPVTVETEFETSRTAGAVVMKISGIERSEVPPRIQVQGGVLTVYVPYGSADGRYPHYRVNSRIIAVHGWSYARHATKNHLQISQGKSVIHGHTHRADACIIQNIWSPGKIVQARSAGCLCKPIPLYGTGRPVEWVNAFILGYLGRRSDTLYTIPIMDNRCILPDGAEVTA